jgi:hypothetical protein
LVSDLPNSYSNSSSCVAHPSFNKEGNSMPDQLYINEYFSLLKEKTDEVKK